ncbi:hypothetical protein FM106_01030 [Brachybacterium faecium]|nr:hypothetical protein FM106_01030 [Brachybacterium faecium]
MGACCIGLFCFIQNLLSHYITRSYNLTLLYSGIFIILRILIF